MQFISGGTGFIGFNLNKFLQRHSQKAIFSGQEGEQVADMSHAISPKSFPEVFREVECVFHQAADNDTQIFDRDRFYKANVQGTMDLVELATNQGVRHFVVASSTAIYGNQNEICTEETVPDPLTPYAESKLEMERELSKFAQEHDVHITCLRYCNVFGDGESHKGKRASMIYQINQKARTGEIIRLFKHGEQVRNWIYVKDIAMYNWVAYQQQKINRSHGSARSFEIYNAANSEHCDFNGLIEIFEEVYGKKIDVEYIDNPFTSTYQDNLRISIKKAEENLSLSPGYSIKDGIKEMVELLG